MCARAKAPNTWWGPSFVATHAGSTIASTPTAHTITNAVAKASGTRRVAAAGARSLTTRRRRRSRLLRRADHHAHDELREAAVEALREEVGHDERRIHGDDVADGDRRLGHGDPRLVAAAVRLHAHVRVLGDVHGLEHGTREDRSV